MRRPMFRHLLLGAVLAAPLLLAGCGGDDGVPQNFPPLRYNYLAPISLNVASIQTQVNIAPNQSGTVLDPMSPEAPLQAVQQMIQDRLVAGGSGGTGVITITSASINQVNDTAVGNISLRLTVTSADGRSRGYTDASVNRTRTMPDDTSQAALRTFLYAMTQDLVNAENVELEYQIRQNLPRWIVGGGSTVIGGPAAPTPVQAVPLGGPGAPVTGAAVPLAAPMPMGASPVNPATALPAAPNLDTMPGGDLGMPQGNPVPTGQDLSAPALPGAPTPLTPAAPAAGSAMPQLVPVQPNGAMGNAAPAAAPVPTPAPAPAPSPSPAPAAPKLAPAPAPASSGTLPPLPANITP